MIAPGSPLPDGALHGIIPALVTPLDDRERVDDASLAALVDYQIQAGVSALFILGSTGEGPLLPTTERRRAVQATVAAARGRVPVLVGISHPSPPESVALGHLAHESGANALVTTAPYYYLHSQAELIRYFGYLHEQLDLPLTTYDVPSAVKVKLAASTVRVLAEERLIVAIKDSSGDLAGFRDMLLATRHVPHFRALTGSEHYVDAAIQAGGHGGVLGLASVAPALYVRIYQAATCGDWQRANELQQQAIAALGMIFAGHSGGSFTANAIGSFKVALRELGIISSAALATPLQPLSPAEEEAVRRIVRETLPAVGAPASA